MAVFVHMLLLAAFSETRVTFNKEIIKLKPGQFTTGAYQLSVRCGVPRGTVERIIKKLKSEELIEVKTDRQCSLITVLNWDRFQKSEEGNEERMRNDRGTSEERVRTKEECKKEKKEKNIYGEFVFLTEEEHKKLFDLLGETALSDMLERLNNYIGSSGKKYKSHYHTVLAWYKGDKKSSAKKRIVSQSVPLEDWS